ncbi:hypothetical protein, partial [Stenotrophomonas maltophilia]
MATVSLPGEPWKNSNFMCNYWLKGARGATKAVLAAAHPAFDAGLSAHPSYSATLRSPNERASFCST